jgi:RHS repeat-associated protein
VRVTQTDTDHTEGSRYRHLTDETAGNADRYRQLGDTTTTTSRYVGINVTLYGRGEAVAMNYSDSAGTRGGAVYLGKDILGSIRNTTSANGGLEERYEYDAFGKPYRGDLENGMNLGYTGKPYDAATGMYDYGYRDYMPEVARFTTLDPVRDGANWFAYVNNDPVNWVDVWGLRPATIEEQQLHQDAGGGKVDYSGLDIHDRKPTVDEVNQAFVDTNVPNNSTAKEIGDMINEHPAMSLPGGDIYAPNDPNRTEDQNKAMIAHEIEHQSQYENGDQTEVFGKLAEEAKQGPSVYDDPNTLEGKAQQVEDNANAILNGAKKNKCAHFAQNNLKEH